MPLQPTSKEIEEIVIHKIRCRRDVGRKKYGTTMERKDMTQLEWIQHAQEEAMDLCIYLEKIMQNASRTPRCMVRAISDQP